MFWPGTTQRTRWGHSEALPGAGAASPRSLAQHPAGVGAAAQLAAGARQAPGNGPAPRTFTPAAPPLGRHEPRVGFKLIEAER